MMFLIVQVIKNKYEEVWLCCLASTVIIYNGVCEPFFFLNTYRDF